MAPSAMRSQDASSTTPKSVPYPRALAMAPSTRSARTETVTTTQPQNRYPGASRATDPTTTPTVPMTVTRSGLRPARSSPLPIGSVTLDTVDRARELSIEIRPVGLSVAESHGGQLPEGQLAGEGSHDSRAGPAIRSPHHGGRPVPR